MIMNTNNTKIIAMVITIYEEKSYSKENISFLAETIDRDDENLRILGTRFFKFCPSDYAIASILASNDDRIEHLKTKINATITKERLEFLQELIPQFHNL